MPKGNQYESNNKSHRFIDNGLMPFCFIHYWSDETGEGNMG